LHGDFGTLKMQDNIAGLEMQDWKMQEWKRNLT